MSIFIAFFSYARLHKLWLYAVLGIFFLSWVNSNPFISVPLPDTWPRYTCNTFYCTINWSNWTTYAALGGLKDLGEGIQNQCISRLTIIKYIKVIDLKFKIRITDFQDWKRCLPVHGLVSGIQVLPRESVSCSRRRCGWGFRCQDPKNE